MAEQVCAGCGHPVGGLHFQDVTGAVRCLLRNERMSTSGIIGIPYTETCDCMDYQSAHAEYKRKVDEEDRARMKALVAQFFPRDIVIEEAVP